MPLEIIDQNIYQMSVRYQKRVLKYAHMGLNRQPFFEKPFKRY